MLSLKVLEFYFYIWFYVWFWNSEAWFEVNTCYHVSGMWLSTVRRGDVLSAWSGIRPLVLNPNARDTQSIARNHIIEVSSSNLITIAGLSFYCLSDHCYFKMIEINPVFARGLKSFCVSAEALASNYQFVHNWYCCYGCFVSMIK